MKKITLFLFALFSCWQISAQVGILQSFPTTTAPTAWTLGGGSLSTDQSCATASWRKNVYSSTTGGILTSESQISNGSDLTISFDYKIVNWSAATVATNPFNGTITTEVSIDGGTTWTVQAGVINSTNHVASNTCTTKTYVVPGASVPNASSVKVRWNCVWGTSGDYYVYIDNISATQPTTTPPLCTTLSTPANNASNVANSIISWAPASGIPTGYKLRVGSTSGGTDVLNNVDVGNVLTYTLPQLDSGTTYFVTVTPYNANGDATGCAETSFTTCDISTDFVQNFESTTGTNFPDCWTKVGNSGTAYTQASTGISGARNLYMYSTSTTSRPVVAIQSVSNANAGTHRMRMKVRGNFTAGETIEFGYLVNPSDATTFTSISSIVTNSTTTAQDFVIVPLGMPAGNVVFALRTGTATYSVLIDDVAWEPIPAVVPTCVAITSPTDQAINVTNSRVTWSTSLDATGYKISVGYSSGATDVLNMFDVGNVTSYVVPTDPGTTYFVTVYPYNSFGTATGCSEISFTTCDALFPDVTETFATFLPSCWQEADGGNTTAGPVTFGSGPWSSDGFGNSGTTGALKINLDYLNDNGWIISPVISIPTSGYELKYDAAATQYAQTVAPTTAWESDDFVEVLVSTSGMNNWTVLYTYNNTNVPATTGTNNIIDLDAYAGMDVRFAFRGVEGTTDGGADIDFFIDNFNVRLTPASAPSCATNIVATPNATCGNFATVITWDAAVSADGYNIAIGTTPGTGNVFSGNLGNVLTYSFIGNIGTTYYYTIVPYNASGSATGCTEQSFTTNASGCYCVSAPTSVDGTGITNVQLVATNFANTVSTSPVYNDHTATVVDMSQGISNSVQITFNTDSFGTSYDYNTVIWIDVNDNFTFEPSEIVFTGVSAAVSPTILNASFVMPGTAPLGQHRMRIVATDALQTPANPCYSGSYGETADFTVNIVAASCTPPAATTTVVPACGTAQYSIDVNVTALGSGTPSITDGTTTWPVSAIGVVNVGPFASGSSVTLTLLHGSDATCNLPLGTFNYSCPPANDDCVNAIALTPGGVFADYPVVGTTVNATTVTGLTYSCQTNRANDVWYSVVVPASGTITIETQANGGSALTDTVLSVFSGTCGALVEVGCDDDNGVGTFSIVNLTQPAGTTLYIGVWRWSSATNGTFQVSAYDASLSSGSFDNANFVAYPNPVKDFLNVSYSSEISSIRVINMIGQEVIFKNINATSTQVDMSELSAGTYIVNVTLGDAVKTLKVVKQ